MTIGTGVSRVALGRAEAIILSASACRSCIAVVSAFTVTCCVVALSFSSSACVCLASCSSVRARFALLLPFVPLFVADHVPLYRRWRTERDWQSSD